jgi:hypothetical protein
VSCDAALTFGPSSGQIFLKEDQFKLPLPCSSGLAVAVLHVQLLRRLLFRGRVEAKIPAPQFGSPAFEESQDCLAEALALVFRENAHPLDFGAVWRHSLDCAHRDNLGPKKANEKLTAVHDIDVVDMAQVVVPGAIANVCPSGKQSRVVERPHSGAIILLILSDSYHSGFPIWPPLAGPSAFQRRTVVLEVATVKAIPGGFRPWKFLDNPEQGRIRAKDSRRIVF